MVLIRAREYERARKVVKAHIELGGWIYGLVKGSEAMTYSQVIHYSQGPAGIVIEGDCTCPTGKNCKHSGAVLFHLIANHSFDRVPEGAEALAPDTNPILEKWLASVQDAAEDQTRPPEGARQELLYVIKVERVADRFVPLLQPMTAQISREDVWKQVQHFRLASLRAQTAPRYLRRSDVELLKRLETHLKSSGENASFDLSGVDAPPLLQQVLETGRTYWNNVQGKKVVLGPPVSVEPGWVSDELGFQEFRLKGMKGKVIPLNPPWYVQPSTGLAGPLVTGLNPRVAQALSSAPPIRPENSARVRQVLGAVLGRNSPLLPILKEAPQLIRVLPKPCLSVGWTCVRQAHSSSTSQKNISVPSATLTFKYLDHQVAANEEELRFADESGIRRVIRDRDLEQSAQSKLEGYDWLQVDGQSKWSLVADHSATQRPTHILGPDLSGVSSADREQMLLQFMDKHALEWESDGWEVHWEDGSRLRIDPVVLQASVVERDSDHYEMHVGATVENDTLDLKPILKQLSKSGVFDRESTVVNHYQRTSTGKVLAISMSRLREIFLSLSDLFTDPVGHDLLIPKMRALEVENLAQSFDSIHFPERIASAIDRFGKDAAPLSINLTGFSSDLRPYQRDGVLWLRFLYDFGFGGILADDMGLGKTVQTLAHIQSLKSEGKLTKPCLIVAPTSTLPNWLAEMKRFVPGLTVLMLHGSTRKESFEEIITHDVILTSYPLLVRDRETLLKESYAIVILDEAQNIKNPSTHAAKAAYEIVAESKIALSGTPVENHLEELWSIFRFSLPGLLGGQSEFRRDFRLSMEAGLRPPREKLEKRIRPFFLRRTKEQVAPELPSKTEIVDYVSLEPAQRELYDAVALAADRQIRDSILSRGWDETRFDALNALLRLRQICCDPRLVKNKNSEPEEVPDSSKLERLISMLHELKDAGRRTLVFSQFTSMLDLIEARLREEGIEWVRLCGSTKDRAHPVQVFQSGAVPVFLISLKAGGVGLNLTAADTVVHYDPWWNPAVERQATDRAHRIGQDKPVFVYKLVAANTVEDRILRLQERKAELSQMLLGNDGPLESALSPQDLHWMLTDSLGG